MLNAVQANLPQQESCFSASIDVSLTAFTAGFDFRAHEYFFYRLTK